MSIHAPEYDRPPPALRPRFARVLAIWENQVRERATAMTVVVVAFLYLIIVLTVVVEFTFETAIEGILGPLNPLNIFYAPYGDLATFFFLTLLACSVGARAVAGDTSSRAITLYLARPITVLDYLGAKASAVATWIFLGIGVPGIIADIIALALGDISLSVAVEAGAGIVLIALLVVLALTGLALLFSSLTSRATLAGAGLFGFLIGSEVVVAVVNSITQNASVLYGSVAEDMMAVARWAFGLSAGGVQPGPAALVLLVYAGVALVGSFLVVRTTEVVGE